MLPLKNFKVVKSFAFILIFSNIRAKITLLHPKKPAKLQQIFGKRMTYSWRKCLKLDYFACSVGFLEKKITKLILYLWSSGVVHLCFSWENNPFFNEFWLLIDYCQKPITRLTERFVANQSSKNFGYSKAAHSRDDYNLAVQSLSLCLSPALYISACFKTRRHWSQLL